MRLRIKYFIYIGVLHAALLTLNIIFLRDQPWLFLIAEVALIASLYTAWRLYKAFVVPIQLMAAGAESLKMKDFSVQFNHVGQRELDTLIDVYNNMIDQLRKERTYHEQQNYLLDKVMSASPAGILLLDLDGHVFSLNPAAERILGQSLVQLKGQVMELLPSPFGKELPALPLDKVVVFQAQGTHFYRCIKSKFVDKGFERQFILIEELTEEILRTEKQAYDKVIRMMSHEVNNSICAINSILQSFVVAHPEDGDFQEAIEVAMNRNNRLVKFMGNFANVVKIPPPRPEIENIQALLKNMTRLMEAECRKRQVELVLDLQEEIVQVPLDVEQFEQVLVNVLKNALESVDKSGKIIVKLDKTSLRILDNGKGIAPEVEKKIFTPFYSTKPTGQGVGLMLIREILRNHNFPFSLKTRPDGWTEFYIGWRKKEEIVSVD